jgi:hypothetical protein
MVPNIFETGLGDLFDIWVVVDSRRLFPESNASRLACAHEHR